MHIIWILAAFLLLTAVFKSGECAIDRWVTPAIAAGNGGNGAVTTKMNNGLSTTDATGITIEASTDQTSISTYSITTQTPEDVTFAIANSGVLTISAGTLDYSITTEYVLVIVAIDNAGASGSASVTVSVQDQPMFEGASLAYTIADESSAGTTLATVPATKVNSATLTYTLASGNTNTDFVVNNVGLITTVNVMDAATLAGYSLVLEADDGALTGTTTVWVAVTDCTSGTTAAVISLHTLLMTLVVSLH